MIPLDDQLGDAGARAGHGGTEVGYVARDDGDGDGDGTWCSRTNFLSRSTRHLGRCFTISLECRFSPWWGDFVEVLLLVLGGNRQLIPGGIARRKRSGLSPVVNDLNHLRRVFGELNSLLWLLFQLSNPLCFWLCDLLWLRSLGLLWLRLLDLLGFSGQI
jgi:hypothetical protein